MNKEILLTDQQEADRKKQDRALQFHFNASSCDELEKPLAEYEQFIIRDGFVFQLENIISNNSKSCPKRHNSDTAVYKLFDGAIGYDS